ncbi:MAG: BatA and WFA domain-containing protein, partial [Verrucomicrobia bacterium]|nr:BatA and WFA domain-containing protein [Verrucomicrobiota bacterium]
MSITFANPALWPFLVLATVPLLVHLFARTRPPAYRFSSVEFILRAVRETLRIKRPQNWLLLLLRTALYLAVLLLFLQPLFFSSRGLPGAFERKNVVVIVDATASMGCTEGGQTRFAAACANASDILGGLTARDQANIVWLRSRSRAEFPALGINVSALQVALRRAAVTSETGNPLDAWQMALELLKDAEGRREIHVVSDFQAPQWDRVRLGAPAGVEVVHLRIGDDVVANGALADIHLEPARPLAGEEVSICCEVDNFSPKP